MFVLIILKHVLVELHVFIVRTHDVNVHLSLRKPLLYG